MSFDGAASWIDSPPLTAANLSGKVVLVDFFDYTCLNCLRTLPYLREWYRRYKDDGFIIVGVASPAYSFSGKRGNVEAAMKRLQMSWPVAMDPAHTLWSRFHVNVWPTEMLYDGNGNLIESHTGEGAYQETEAKIQAALRAAHPGLALPPLMALLPQDNYTKPGAVCYPQSNEIVAQLMSPADKPAFGDPSKDLEYVDSGSHRDGAIYLNGYWHRTPEGIVSGGGGGYFDFVYHAIEVAVVMTSARGPSRVDVTQDGKPIAREDAGGDVQYDGSGMSYVLVDAPRSYHLIENKQFAQHELRLTPQSYGIGIYEAAFESCEVPK